MTTLSQIKDALAGVELPPDFDEVCKLAIFKMQQDVEWMPEHPISVKEIKNAMRAYLSEQNPTTN